jgi:hypothetical protein
MARVKTQAMSCGIFGGESGNGERFSPNTSISPANSHSISCSTLIIIIIIIIIYSQGPKYKVESVSPHPNSLKTTLSFKRN